MFFTSMMLILAIHLRIPHSCTALVCEPNKLLAVIRVFYVPARLVINF
uniref:G-protein coupled receptors family 1 profile domain-containing protein n=1 Tax=Anguilla anguilla TaxID=7936 RepID=A0A0E9U917_ANGAN